jgi:hypothetical protein
MNRSTQYVNSVYLLSLLDYKVICVDEGEKSNTWVWSYDLSHEETYPSGYSEHHAAIMMSPNLYAGHHIKLINQVLTHGRDYFPVFNIHMLANPLDIPYDKKELARALNLLVLHAQKDIPIPISIESEKVPI